MISNLRQNKKAFGLVEVLIALVFVASSMIVALNTVSKALKISKDNEIKDKATGVLLSGLEYGNADNKLNIPFDRETSSDNECYKLNAANVDGNTGQSLKSASVLSHVTSSCEEIDSCSESSFYKVNIPGMDICSQIIFTKTNLDGSPMQDKIRVTSIIAYYLNGEILTEKLHSFRDIKTIPQTP